MAIKILGVLQSRVAPLVFSTDYIGGFDQNLANMFFK